MMWHILAAIELVVVIVSLPLLVALVGYLAWAIYDQRR